MSNRTLDSRHSMESFTMQLHSWRPFQLQTPPKALDSDASKPHYYAATPSSNGVRPSCKRPCLTDRVTSFPVDVLDMSRLSLFDDDRSVKGARRRDDGLRLVARRKRHRGSRSVSGRSSDRSGTRQRCCSVGASAAYCTCSDFHVAVGTDSSGELFVNGDVNWASDVSEAARNSRRETDGGSGERECCGNAFGLVGNSVDSQGNESGYGSEPGYRGDGEFGYGDEVDEEEDDPRLFFWGGKLGATVPNMGIVGEHALQKTHHRCRRKKHDLRMVDSVR